MKNYFNNTIKMAILMTCIPATVFAGEFCQDKADGYHPDPDDCSAYIVCSHDGQSQQEMDCPEGLSWNTDGQYCDWDENVDCEAQEPSNTIDLVNYGGLSEFANKGMNVAEMDECVIACDGGYWECACVFDAELDPNAECWTAFEKARGVESSVDLSLQKRFAMVIEDAKVRHDESLILAVMNANACINAADSETDLAEEEYTIEHQSDTTNLVNYGGISDFSDMGMNVAEMDECVIACDGGYWECACVFDAELDPNAACWNDLEQEIGFKTGDELHMDKRFDIVRVDALQQLDFMLVQALNNAQMCLYEE